MVKFKKIVALGAFCLSCATSSFAAVLDIDFNGNNFLLGAFESAETGASFYRYSTDFDASAAPFYPGTTNYIPLQADALQIFAHVNTNTDELSFGLILEKPNGSGGGTFDADATWSTPATVALVDDPNEGGTNIGDTSADIDLQWVDCCTDGLVISGFDPNDLFLNLANVTGSDLSSVIFLSPNGQSSNTTFNFPTDQFNISIQSCDPQTDPNGCVIPDQVPSPAPLALIALGLLGLRVSSRRSR